MSFVERYKKQQDEIRDANQKIESVNPRLVGTPADPISVSAWAAVNIGGSGGSGGTGVRTDYADLGEFDGTANINIALDGDAEYIRKITLANSSPITFGITSANLPNEEIVELYVLFQQDDTGGRTLLAPSATIFPDGDLLNSSLNVGPDEVTKFRFVTYDAGSTWYIEKVGLVSGSEAALAALADVDIDNIQDNQILAYDTGTSSWQNIAISTITSSYGDNEVLTYLTNLGSDAWEGFTNWVTAVVNEITDWLRTTDTQPIAWLRDTIYTPLASAVEGVIGWWDNLSVDIQNAISTVVELFATPSEIPGKIVEWIVDGFSDFWTAFFGPTAVDADGTVTNATPRFITELDNQLTAFAEWVLEGLVTDFEYDENESILTNTLAAIARALFGEDFATTVLAGISAVGAWWNDLSVDIQNAISTVVDLFANAAEIPGRIINWIFESTSTFFNNLFNATNNIAEPLLEYLVTGFNYDDDENILTNTVNAIIHLITNNASSFVNALRSGFDAVYQTATDVANAVAGFATEAWVGLQGFATEAWVGLQNFATQAWVGLQNFATEAWVGLQGFVSDLSDYATQAWVTAHNYITDVVTAVTNNASAVASALVSNLQTTFDSVYQTATQVGNAIKAEWDRFWMDLGGSAAELPNTIEGVINGIVTFLTGGSSGGDSDGANRSLSNLTATSINRALVFAESTSTVNTQPTVSQRGIGFDNNNNFRFQVPDGRSFRFVEGEKNLVDFTPTLIDFKSDVNVQVAGHVRSTLTPLTNGVYDLGSSTRKWDEIHGEEGRFDRLYINGEQIGITEDIYFNEQVLPVSNNRLKIVNNASYATANASTLNSLFGREVGSIGIYTNRSVTTESDASEVYLYIKAESFWFGIPCSQRLYGNRTLVGTAYSTPIDRQIIRNRRSSEPIIAPEDLETPGSILVQQETDDVDDGGIYIHIGKQIAVGVRFDINDHRRVASPGPHILNEEPGFSDFLRRIPVILGFTPNDDDQGSEFLDNAFGAEEGRIGATTNGWFCVKVNGYWWGIRIDTYFP